jgi:hypothetical protein
LVLDDFIKKGRGGECSILVTQPRRISAMSVSERIAKERVEPIGHSTGMTYINTIIHVNTIYVYIYYTYLLHVLHSTLHSIGMIYINTIYIYNTYLLHISNCLTLSYKHLNTTIGYHIRLETKKSSATRLLLLTTGELHHNPYHNPYHHNPCTTHIPIISPP